ncbi:MAG: D-alanyl-D-alanine carboxypeptidase [Cyclobacteriaceae bacterium]|nr:D-alanyl-D-alanine carboxypeptidase [Cyclobacteriaceae bacterium]
MKYLRLFFALIVIVQIGCSPVSTPKLTRQFQEIETRFQDHTGFVLYDPEKRETIFSYNGDKYFTPASNTKIFTLFASFNVLGDSIPALQYVVQGDSLIFTGTGDGSFLYDQVFNNNRTYDFLKNSGKELYYVGNNFYTTPLGRGWAWNDYQFSYSPERSAFPMFGNMYTVTQPTSSGIRVSPTYFKKYFWLADSAMRASSFVREIGSNRIDFFPGRSVVGGRQWKVPFRTSDLVVADLLSDTLKTPVYLINTPLPTANRKVFYSVPVDSVYKVMMQASDNFLAEQLLLQCSWVLSDSLRPEIAIRHIKQNYFTDLPDDPIWLDGSGLSRNNLFTPRSIVKLWEKLYVSVDRERLFPLLAIGGKAGTIRNYYKKDPPYIFGKTGTLSNNHLLSGYLITAKGRTLIFSYMNNKYVAPTADIRSEMEKVLLLIHDNF